MPPELEKGVPRPGRARLRVTGTEAGPPSSPRPLISPQAIAHYEQSADYYKGEESNRYPPTCPHLRCRARCPLSSCLSPLQLSQQVSAEGGWLRRPAGAVSEGHRHL